MGYILNTTEDQQAMLEAIGVGSLEDLFSLVPAELRLRRDLEIPPALGEMELTARLTALAQRNVAPGQKVCFLGGGSYDHFIPAVVDYVAGRGEFYTSYTPYQPEASQGNLQVFFEYQTLITQLTGADVSNASLYDGASATAEAVLMCLAAGDGRRRVVMPRSVHPEYRATVATYLANLDAPITLVDTPLGTITPDELGSALDGSLGDETACVVLQYPNFFGCIEELEALAAVAHARGALVVVAFDPISLGLLKRPGDCGADIVVAEGQSLGTPMQFGGPYLGIMACREQFVRRMPGRITGQTVDRRGRRCWSSHAANARATYPPRKGHEQHLHQPRLVRAAGHDLSGRARPARPARNGRALPAEGRLCPQGAHVRASEFSLAFDRPTFKEFVIRDAAGGIRTVRCRRGSAAGFFAGVPLGRWYPEFADCLLVCVTERRTRQEIDDFVRFANEHERLNRRARAHDRRNVTT